MSVEYWKDNSGNFGDEVNGVLWRGLVDLDALERNGITMYGVGSILGRGVKDIVDKRCVVMGSGVPQGGRIELPSNWDVRWVRGPYSAEALGVSGELGVGDPAILLPELTHENGVHGDGCGGG